MANWRDYPIRSVRDLMRALAGGGRLVKWERWQVSRESGWREWTVEHADGTRQAVDGRIAVTAHRQGLVKYQEAANGVSEA